MKTLFIVNHPPYGTEHAFNALQVGVCSTCLDARGLTDEELAEGPERSTLEELADWTEWAEKVLVF